MFFILVYCHSKTLGMHTPIRYSFSHDSGQEIDPLPGSIYVPYFSVVSVCAPNAHVSNDSCIHDNGTTKPSSGE